MPKEFIIRGQTTVGAPTEVLNMSGYRPGYGYVLKELSLYPSTAVGTASYEMMATVTADNSSEDPQGPNFNNEGLLATTFVMGFASRTVARGLTVVNDLFVITQDLILQVFDTQGAPVNWQVRFKEVKLSSSAEAVANYKQYTIYNTSS